MAKRQEKKETPVRAPVQAHPDIPGWGVDLDRNNRPGVPFYKSPAPLEGAYWDQPPPQPPELRRLRPELPRVTPVFGTAQPPQGLSGALRRMAYTLPDHRLRRWMLLLAADRVDAYGGSLATGGVILAGAGLAVWLLRSDRMRGLPVRRPLTVARTAFGM